MSKGKSSPKPAPKTTIRVRSAIDGTFKPKGYDKTHPNTTVRERVPLPGHGDTN